MGFEDVLNVPRDQRQEMVAIWARAAFGEAESSSIPQRGLRLLEEAIEAFQACGGDEAIAHKLVAFVFARPSGTVSQELGGVAVTALALAAAAGLSADEEECREIHRVINKPLREFTERNANKNAAGFLVARRDAQADAVHDGERRRFSPLTPLGEVMDDLLPASSPLKHATHGQHGQHCVTCGQEMP